MKSYQLNLQEIHLPDADIQNVQLLEAYQKLFTEMLDAKTLSMIGIFEKLDLLNSSMSDKPSVTEPLLRQKKLPGLIFLICSN